jgi:tetratricopeptide (TPR) repeat protein
VQRVGAWRESIEANRASARAAGDKSFDKWHAHDYIVYAHLQLGEHQAARQVVEEALNNPARVDHLGTAYAYAAMPARLALERAAWGEAAGLELFAADSFPWKKYTFAEAVNAFARGIGAAKSGDPARARVEVERLEKLREATKVPYWAEQIAIQAEVVKGLVLLADGDGKQALTTLRAAAKREDATEKHAVTPGPIVPAREVLAYVLLDKGEAKGALREFEAVLAKEPNRLRALAGAVQAAERSNNRKKAKEYAAKLPV